MNLAINGKYKHDLRVNKNRNRAVKQEKFSQLSTQLVTSTMVTVKEPEKN